MVDLHGRDFSARESLSDALSYISHIASSLLELGLIDEHTVHEFQNVVRSKNIMKTDATEGSLSFFQYKSPLVDLCISHYGERRLFMNWVRFTLKNQIEQFDEILVELEKTLIYKTKLFFNHPHYIYVDNLSDRRIIHSEFLMDMSETIDSIRKNINQLAREHLHLAPSYPAIDEKKNKIALDKHLLKRLELFGIKEEVLPSYGETALMRGLSYNFHLFGLMIKSSGEQLYRNTENNLFSELSFIGEDMITVANSLERIDFPIDGTFSLWENRRIKLKTILDEIKGKLIDIRNVIDTNLVPENLNYIRQRRTISKAHLNQLEQYLVQQTNDPELSKLATITLKNYCDAKTIDSSEILDSELKRLHPLLDENFVLFWKDIDRKFSLSIDIADIKENLLNRFTRLNDQITKNSGYFILILTILVSSCGLKTAPRANMSDLRPEIPFRNEASTEKTDKSKPIIESKVNP